VAALPEHCTGVLRALPSPDGRTARSKEAGGLSKTSLRQARNRWKLQTWCLRNECDADANRGRCGM